MRNPASDAFDPRIVFFNRSFYFDDSCGAAIASRALLEYLAHQGFAVEVICGTIVDGALSGDPADWLSQHGWPFTATDGGAWSASAAGVRSVAPPTLRLSHNGVNVTVLHAPFRKYEDPTLAEGAEILPLFEATLDKLRPNLFLTYGGDSLTRECLARARRRRVATVFALHNFFYREGSSFAEVDAVVVPSQFAADYYASTLGLDCTVLPNLVDPKRVIVEHHEPKYLTFVNPSIEKGVYAFARIAEELGKTRPDIPILVVESRGTEETVAACGLDLRRHGNVFFMSHTSDPRLLAADEALPHAFALLGIPGAGGGRGIDERNPRHRQRPRRPARDDRNWRSRASPSRESHASHAPGSKFGRSVAPGSRRSFGFGTTRTLTKRRGDLALDQSKQWHPHLLGSKHLHFFKSLGTGSGVRKTKPWVRSKWVVLVPHLNAIEWQCEESLRKLEEEGVKVVRREGCSQIDLVAQ